MQRRFLSEGREKKSAVIYTNERLISGERMEYLPDFARVDLPHLPAYLFLLNIGIDRIVIEPYLMRVSLRPDSSYDPSDFRRVIMKAMRAHDPDISMSIVSGCNVAKPECFKGVLSFTTLLPSPLWERVKQDFSCWHRSEEEDTLAIIRSLVLIPGVAGIRFLSNSEIKVERSYFGRWQTILPQVKKLVSEYSRFSRGVYSPY